MEEWKEYKLGEVGKITTGKTPKTAIKEFFDGKILFVTPADINTPYKYVSRTARYLSEEGLNSISSNSIEKGSICVSCIGNIGYVGIVDMNCASNQQINSITVNQGHDRDFIYYAIKNLWPYFKNYEGQSTTLSILNKGQFSKIVIKLPHKEIQQRIASILSALDDKIEVNRKINENLEQQAQALFKSWFVDFEPFKNGEFVESELGMIPKGWKLKRIYEHIDVIYGAPYKSSLFNDKKEGLPLIRIRDLKTNSPQFYTSEILPNTEYIEAGDIVAGMDAEFTPYVWQGERGVLNQRCCKFTSKFEGISNFYILFLIKPELEYVQSYKTGTTVSHLGKSDIDRFVFITPPLNIVLAFSEIVNPMLKEMVNRAKESRRLAELRDTLLPKLMSGELKVNEIEDVL